MKTLPALFLLTCMTVVSHAAYAQTEWKDTEAANAAMAMVQSLTPIDVLAINDQKVELEGPAVSLGRVTMHPGAELSISHKPGATSYVLTIDVLQLPDPTQKVTISLGHPPSGTMSGRDGANGSTGRDNSADSAKGDNGGAGARGADGATFNQPAFYVFVKRVEGPSGIIPPTAPDGHISLRTLGLEFNNQGLNGGDGGRGGVGGQGGAGGPGRNNADGPFHCRRGCRDGGNGGNGGRGGHGGNGATGGRGGQIIFVGPEDLAIAFTFLRSHVDGGSGGRGGSPGTGGRGGNGGSGVSASRFCSSCSAGARGNTAASGKAGSPGKAGARGSIYYWPQ